MGPGGLRGLQILRLGAHRVRGGFDSHAFPPLYAAAFAVLMGMACCAATAQARGSERFASGDILLQESEAITVSDSGRVITGPETGRIASGRDTSRIAPAKPSRFSTPRWVMLRSLVVPGWGQAHNGAWIKAAAVAATEVAFTTRVVADQRELDRLAENVARARASDDIDLEEAAVAAYNERLDASFARQYLLGAVVVYALVDAYVDAHFRHFKVEFETDPALPEGMPEEVGVRVGWEWNF